MFGLDGAVILEFIRQYAEAMIRNLNPTVMSLLGSFLVIDLTLSFLFDESDGMNIFIKLLKKVLYYGFFIWIIQDYSTVIFKYLMSGAIQLGNVASGKGASTSIDFNLISKFGLDAGDLAGAFAFTGAALLADKFGIESASTVVLMGVFGYLMFFIMLYVQILVVFAKFYLISGYAFLLMPFAVFDKTKDIALKALNGLFSQAIEIYVLVVLLNLCSEFMDGPFAPTMGLELDNFDKIKESIFMKYGILIFLFFLINKAGSIASSLLAGSIASIGIGASAGERGMSNAVSAPGNLARGMADKASAYNPNQREDYQGGAKMFRKGSSAANAYTSASNFIKGKFGKNNNNSSE